MASCACIGGAATAAAGFFVGTNAEAFADKVNAGAFADSFEPVAGVFASAEGAVGACCPAAGAAADPTAVFFESAMDATLAGTLPAVDPHAGFDGGGAALKPSLPGALDTDEYFASSSSSKSDMTFWFLSSATCGFEDTLLSISLAILAASCSVMPILDLSICVVYTDSSNFVSTPNSCLFAAN